MKELENSTSQEVDWSKYPFDSVLQSFLSTAFHHHLPIAAWRLPHQHTRHIIVDTSGEAPFVEWQLEDLPAGFMASPFLNSEEQSPYIQADIHYRSDREKFQVNPKARRSIEVIDRLRQEVHQVSQPRIHTVAFDHTSIELDATAFCAIITQAVRAIEQGDFKKVVPSRYKRVALPDHFDAARTFQQLCNAYPTAFVSLFSIPGVGTWMGASPEILVSTYPDTKRRMFRTMALAGTQPMRGDNPLKNAAWRQKEIEEQAMVSRYIINCFKRIRLREFDEDGPKTTAAGNLLHLRTDFTVDMNATNFPELGSVMLRLLHPTSAVCGMPKEPTLEFIRQHEGYDRSFYSGFLGPVNMQDETHLFVNLRCMQLLDRQAILYAGAGVTADSEPEREWEETEMKMRTMQQFLIL